MPQMQQAAKLGAFIEFDMRNVLEGERCGGNPARWARLFSSPSSGHGKATRMYTRASTGSERLRRPCVLRGFSDDELDLLFKVNPARILGLEAP